MALPKQENFASLSSSSNLNTLTGWTAFKGNIQGAPPSGGGVVSGDSADSYYAWTGDTFSNNQYAQIVVGTTGTPGAYFGPVVRCNSDGCYYVHVSPGNDATGYVAALHNSFTSETGARNFVCPAAGTTIRLEISGTTLTLKGNGSIIQTRVGTGTYEDSWTDSTQSSGSAGIAAYASQPTPVADDWEGGDVSGGGGSSITPTVGSGTYTGNSSPMNYTMTPRTA